MADYQISIGADLEGFDAIEAKLKSLEKGFDIKFDSGKAIKDIDKLTQKSAKAQKNIYDAVNRGFQTDKFKKQLNDVNSQFGKLDVKTRDSRLAVKDFNKAFDDLKIAHASKDISKITSAWDAYQKARDKALNNLSLNKTVNTGELDKISGRIKKINDIQKQIHDTKLDLIKADPSDTKGIDSLTKKLGELQEKAKQAQKYLDGSYKEKAWSKTQEEQYNGLLNKNKINESAQAYSRLENQIAKIKIAERDLKKLEQSPNKNSNAIANQNQYYNKLLDTYNKSKDLFKDVGLISDEQIGNLDKAFNDTTAVDKMIAKYKDLQKAKADNISMDKAQRGFNSFTADATKTIGDLEKIGASSDELKQKLADVGTAFSELSKAKQQGNSEDILRANEAYVKSLDSAKTTLEANNRAVKDYKSAQVEIAKAQLTMTKSSTLSNNIENWMKRNTQAAKTYGNELKAIQEQLKDNTSADVLRNANAQFQNIKSMSSPLRTFGGQLKNIALQATGLYGTMMVVNKAVSTLKDMFNNVVEVDTAMTELYRVTNLSSEKYNQLYQGMTSSAKQYGIALSDIINSTASWVRLGFSPDNATQLAEVTAMYQHVTDLNEETAVKNLVTAYKGFEKSLLSVNNGDSIAAISSIADIYDKLGA